MPCPPSSSSYNHTSFDTKQQQHQQHLTNDRQNVDDTAVRAKAAAFAMRNKWKTKAASLQRGLEHVQNCHAGDACGSSLCHSTRRLMRTYETHPCLKKSRNPNGNYNNNMDCRICKLWDFLMVKQQLPRQKRGLSCGSELVLPRERTRPSVLHRRITTAQLEAQNIKRCFSLCVKEE